jgi:hypothetical protein
MDDKIYKIINKETGLFSKGGKYVRWTKNGKVWTKLSHLKNHLGLFMNCDGIFMRNNPYENAEVVEFQIKYEETQRFDVMNLMNELSNNKKQYWIDYKKREKEYKEKMEKERLIESANQYPEEVKNLL